MALKKTNHPRPKRIGNNSTLGEKTAVKTHTAFAHIFGGRTIIKIVAAVAIFLVISGGFFWYKVIFTDPERVYWGMITNNLSTYSVTKAVSQSGESTTNNQLSQLAFTPSPTVRDVKEITNQNSGVSSTVKIESIGTPTDTYQHYVLIDQPPQQGKKKTDFSKVYSLWLKNSGGQQSDSQLFYSSIYSAVLFGNLQVTQRDSLVKVLQSAYKTDFKAIKKESSDGRKTYTYTTTINLRNYAKAVNLYSKSLGLPNTSQIKEDSYKPNDEVKVKLTVDILSRQLRSLKYESSNSVENYITYGIKANYKIPSKTVSYETLQKTVQQAAGSTK